MELTNSVAFVTGGSGGLGSHICSLLSSEGAKIAIGYKSGEQRAETLRDELAESGRESIIVKIDQSNPNSIANAVSQVVKELGSLDILVNNAAMASGGHNLPPGDLEAFTPEIWDEITSINLKGPYLVARAAAENLRKSKWGRIVNIGSTLGHGDWYMDRAFAPSKAAVVPLTRFLAVSLAPDVTVNCVAPGLMIETGMGSGGSDEFVQYWKGRSNLGVTTSIHDVAMQVVVLCKSDTVTGQTVVIDGGINFN